MGGCLGELEHPHIDGRRSRGLPVRPRQKSKPRPSLVGQAKNWQTPSAADTLGGHEKRGGERGDELLLKGQAKAEENWPTPKAVDGRDKGNGGNRKSPTLAVFVPQKEAENWATPTARDWRSGEASQETMERNSRSLNEQVTNWRTPHGMNHENGNGPSGNELGFQVGQHAQTTSARMGEPKAPAF
jgi:hypothetical protein